MVQLVFLVPYEPEMGYFVPVDVYEGQLDEASTTGKQPEPDQDAEAPAPDQPK